MGKYTILPNQALADVAIMTTGTLENLFAIAAANNLSVSDDLVIGTALIIPDTISADTDTLAYIAANQIVIGTSGDITAEDDGVFTDVFGDVFN